MAANRDGSSHTPVKLLQGFLRSQSTRTAIAHELDDALGEAGISEQALQRVIEISSVGLYEQKVANEAIIVQLRPVDGQAADRLEAIEALERERIAHSTRKHQLARVLRLQQDNGGPGVEQLEVSLRESSVKLAQTIEAINEALQDVREKVADLSQDEETG